MRSLRYAFFLLTALAAVLTSCACRTIDGGSGGDDPSPFVGRYAENMSMESSILGHKVQFSILVPENYNRDTDKRYPVVYLLHGYDDNNKSWNDDWMRMNQMIFSLEAEGLGDMIYVYPYGLNTYWCNRYNGKYNYMDMFINELVPYIDSNFRTIPDRNHRSVTGYSMGGFGAVALAEKHPGTFLCSAPLSMSFRTDEQYTTEGPQSSWDSQWGSVFGGIGCKGEARLTDHYKQHCPFYQFTPENKSRLSQVKWYFTCGDNEEQLLIANDALHIQLRDNGYEHEYRVGDGGHDGTYWKKALREVLPMFWYYMNGGQKWSGDARVPVVDRVTFLPDGTYKSQPFADTGKGLAVFFAYSSSSDSELVKDIISLVVGASSKSRSYICIPCNLSVKSFDEWVSEYGKRYEFTLSRAFATGDAGKKISGKGMEALLFTDASLEPGFEVRSGTSYYFSCTDNALNYKDMGYLYKECKQTGVNFEYRVVKGVDKKNDNILISVKEIQHYFTK